jgi:hypothetical protein
MDWRGCEMRDGKEINPRKLHEIGVYREESDGTFTEESLLTKVLRDAFVFGNKIHKTPPQFNQGFRIVFCRQCGSRNYISDKDYHLWNHYEDDYSGKPPGCKGCERW